MSDSNGRVSLREYLTEVINQRFDALERRLEAYCKIADGERNDHEERIRSLEKREPVRNAIETVLGIIAAISVALGLRNT